VLVLKYFILLCWSQVETYIRKEDSSSSGHALINLILHLCMQTCSR